MFDAWRYTRPHDPPGYLGSPQRGEKLVSHYGCAACHVMSNAEPRGLVGPPGTAMPDLGMSERDARDLAVYLATLK